MAEDVTGGARKGGEVEARTSDCPVCGERGIRIVYGLPMPSLFEEADEGEVILGGCVIMEGQDDWQCSANPRHRWSDLRMERSRSDPIAEE